jgi:ComF family protein
MLQEENEHILCSDCAYEKPYYDSMYCLYPYESPIDKLILDLKFNKNFINAKVLSELLIDGVNWWYRNKTLPQALIPMPLHIKRLKKRGFNQVVEFLNPVAKKLNLPIDNNLCERIVFTKPQATLDRKNRKTNLSKAFKVTKSHVYQHVAIVDDVVTTGSTVTALAEKLKQSGVELIDVWCLARA